MTVAAPDRHETLESTGRCYARLRVVTMSSAVRRRGGVRWEPTRTRTLRLLLWPMPTLVGANSLLSAGPLGESVFAGRVLLVVLIAFAVSYAFTDPAPDAQRWRIEDRVTLALFCFLALWGTLALLWSRDPVLGLKAVVNVYLVTATLWSLVLILRRRRDLLMDYCIGWVLVIYVSVAAAMFEVVSGVRLPVAHEEAVQAVLAYSPTWSGGFFRNPNDMGAFLAVALPGALFVTRFATQRWLRAVAWLAIPVSFLGLALTAARASTLAVGLALLAYLVLRDGWSPGAKVVAVSTLIAGALVAVVSSPQLMEKLAELGTSVSATDSNSRTQLAADAIALVLATGGLGVGPANFSQFQNEPGLPFTDLWNFTPHNLYAEVFAEYGFLAGAAFLLWLGFLLVRWIPRSHVAVEVRPILLSGMVVLALVGFQSSYSMTLNVLLLPVTLLLIAAYEPPSGGDRPAAGPGGSRDQAHGPPLPAPSGDAWRPLTAVSPRIPQRPDLTPVPEETLR